MNVQSHGVVSLGLAILAIAVGAVSVFLASARLGVLFLAITAVSGLAVLSVYCAKCPAQTHCGHVLPGLLSRYLKQRPSGAYTKAELVVTGVALLLMIGVPQFWLVRSAGWLLAFWLPLIVAGVQIRSVVCRACCNQHCPARPRASHD